MAIYHRVLKELKEEVRLPLVTGLDAVLAALSPAMGFLLGVVMKHDDFAVSNIPAGDQAVYLAGAKIVGLYPFGPLLGTAASCALVVTPPGTVGINADAAAVPDLDMLAGCIREGFDAVIALADVS